MNWTRNNIQSLIQWLEKYTQSFEKPMSLKIVDIYGMDPFLILISCLLSLRSRDVVTFKVSQALFSRARTAQELATIPIPELETIIRSIGTYKRKARILHEVSLYLLKQYHGQVPSDEQALLAIPGVGRKTANLVRGIAFGIPALCVDVHVHRIANAWELVHTTTPEQTEAALQKIIPRKDWILMNTLLVQVGQHTKNLQAVLQAFMQNNKGT